MTADPDRTMEREPSVCHQRRVTTRGVPTALGLQGGLASRPAVHKDELSSLGASSAGLPFAPRISDPVLTRHGRS